MRPRAARKAANVVIVDCAQGGQTAAAWAKAEDVFVIALTGFSGGRSGALADAHLHVDADNYGVIEDVHQSLMHILAHYLRQGHMRKELVGRRRF